MTSSTTTPAPFAAILLACMAFLGSGAVRADDAEFFERRIRPVLVEHCHKCHSADAEPLKGGLRLDSREALLAGGESGPAVVPGDPDSSRLIRATSHADVDLQMPPKYKLSDAIQSDLAEWVRKGAPWPGAPAGDSAHKPNAGFDVAERKQSHWAWQPVQDPAPPPVQRADWAETPLDRFILAGLEAEGLSPAHPAGKSELLRRATFDLAGLPPTPEEIDSFEADPSPDAFERVVDRLLESPRFGERWARHWFDLVRYAETFGHEFDYPILNAWRYRDYVVRAFNQNLPFDQFLKEQVAGDLLPNPRWGPDGLNESRAATAFHWLGQQVHSPVDIRAYQLDRVDNQIDVLTKTFIGMTVSCARCHDHKFDAISTKDFYALFGVAASSRYTHASLLHPAANAREIGHMQDLKAGVRKTLAESWTQEVADLAAHVRAAVEMSTPAPAQSPATAPAMVVFEDFESGDYANWEATGTAFGAAPQSRSSLPAYQGDVAPVGDRFVNSHRAGGTDAVAGGDQPVGTLFSRPFPIDHDYIHFLIGGGAHVGKTGLRLLIEDKEAAWVSGPNNNRMRPARIDTRAWRGKTARIVIVDQASGGWGNVGVDHILFSDWESVFDQANQPLPLVGSPTEFAKSRGLDPKRLQAVAGLLKSATPAPPAPAKPAWNDLVLFDAGAIDHPWIAEGEAFQAPTVQTGHLRLPPGGSTPILLAEPAIHSAATHTRLEGVLRTESFTIERSHIHIRGGGEESRVNLVVDGFNLIQSPIYGGLKQEFRSSEPRWITINASMWKGHRAYLEFVDQTPGDPASDRVRGPDGFIWVSKILLSDEPTPPTLRNPIELLPSLADATAVVESIQSDLAAWGLDQKPETTPTFGRSLALVAKLLAAGYLSIPDAVAARVAEYHALADRLNPPVYIAAIADGSPENEKVFIRGNPRNLGDEVPRRFIEALNDLPFAHGSGRLELADQLVDKQNPLTARVRVNWIWHHLLGRGLVSSIDNFGVLGELPTHPELLDWLATRFMEQGWDMKRMIRTIVLSKTYQMASRPASARETELDPNNTRLHRANLRRLQGEAIRDAILAVANSLDPRMFGPPVKVHLTEFMDGRGRPGASGPLDGDGRRTIYLEVRRNFLSPMMLAYDTPIPYTTVGRRTVSNVPAQALILMNDPFVVAQAKHWGARVAASPEIDPAQRVAQMHLAALGRLPDSVETSSALAYLREQLDLHRLSEAELASNRDIWADLCHVLLNTKEFIYIQ